MSTNSMDEREAIERLKLEKRQLEGRSCYPNDFNLVPLIEALTLAISALKNEARRKEMLERYKKEYEEVDENDVSDRELAVLRVRINVLKDCEVIECQDRGGKT